MAVGTSVTDIGTVGECGSAVGLADLARFRWDFYTCLTKRDDALFELCEAVLCADGPVKTLVELSLAAQHRRGHGALYDGLNAGRVDIARFRRTLAGLPLPRDAHGRVVLAVDVSNWLRPEAETSPQRLYCHTYPRGRSLGRAQMIPGWPYSVIAALEPGRTSWTAVLDAQRLGPDDDQTMVTADQVRGVVERVIATGHWHRGDPAMLIVFDAGYDICRLAWLLADLPIEVLGRLRSNRVLYQRGHTPHHAGVGRPSRHGDQVRLDDPTSWPQPQIQTSTETTHYGTATATGWERLHPKLARRSSWADHQGTLPIIEGTLIRLVVDHLPGDRNPKPMWLWTSATNLTTDEMNRAWQAFLRRFDLEHTFRLFKQTLGWTRPKLRNPDAADRWTWLIIACHTQLRLARHLTNDIRRPWERPAPPGRLTPARVRRGYRHLHRKLPTPARAPKHTYPGPGRPPGHKNNQPAARHKPGKHPKTDTTA